MLVSAIKTVLMQDYANFEIIVSDNFSCDETKQVVSSFNSEKIRYINTGKRVGMSQNWEFALNHVSGGWVTIIGDDDGLLQGALTRIAELISLTDAKFIRSDTCSYLWPGLNGLDHGVLSIPLKPGFSYRDSDEWIKKVIAGKVGYSNLPVVYNGGFVSFEVLESIKEKSGYFINSMNPDVYLGMAIASAIPRYLYSNYPFAVNGASRHSGGSSAFLSNNSDKDSPSNKFASEANISFHDDLPLCSDGKVVRSLQASAYEAYLQSKHLRRSSILEDHQKQLQVILSVNEGLHNESVEDWAKKFAALHSLDFEKAIKSANGHRFWLKISKGLNAIYSFVNRHVVSGNRYLLNDVYQAAIVASTIISVKPSRLNNILGLLKRGLRKLRITT